MTRRLLIAAVTGPFLDPTTYGAECDMEGVYDAVVDVGDLSEVVSATAAFEAADTGKTYTLASTAGAVTTGTLTFVDATHATMSTAAGGAMTGARLIFGTDDHDAWQLALDAAAPGQTVDCADPAFRSLIGSPLDVPVYVTLGRGGRAPFEPNTNPAMFTHGPTLGIIEDVTDPFVTLHRGAGFGDLLIYSINQVPPTASAPIARGPIIKTAQGGCHIGSPYLANAYHGLQLESGRHHVGRPQIGALKWGVVVDQSLDVIDIDYITCHPYWRICEGMAYTPTAGSLDEWALEEAIGLLIYRADGLHVGSLFTFGIYNTLSAYDSPDTGLSPRAGWAHIGMLEADSVAYGIAVKSTADTGIIVGQGRFSAHPAGVGTAGQAAVITLAGGAHTPEVVVGNWTHRGTWANAASVNGAGTLIVPATNPG